jgi:hypothetical protein
MIKEVSLSMATPWTPFPPCVLRVWKQHSYLSFFDLSDDAAQSKKGGHDKP